MQAKEGKWAVAIKGWLKIRQVSSQPLQRKKIEVISIKEGEVLIRNRN
jgi:hypothetical protein